MPVLSWSRVVAYSLLLAGCDLSPQGAARLTVVSRGQALENAERFTIFSLCGNGTQQSVELPPETRLEEGFSVELRPCGETQLVLVTERNDSALGWVISYKAEASAALVAGRETSVVFGLYRHGELLLEREAGLAECAVSVIDEAGVDLGVDPLLFDAEPVPLALRIGKHTARCSAASGVVAEATFEVRHAQRTVVRLRAMASNQVRLSVGQNAAISEGGTRASVRVSMAQLPEEAVTVALSVDDPTEGSFSGGLAAVSLSLTPEEALNGRDVEVLGVDDDDDDGDVAFNVVVTSVSTGSGALDVGPLPSLRIVNRDNDIAPPSMLTTSPLSPSNHFDGPFILGKTEPRAAVQLFIEACSGEPVTQVLADDSGLFSIPAPLFVNTTQAYVVRATTELRDGTSACSEQVLYTHDDTLPMLSEFSFVFVPNSPSNNAMPTLSGQGVEAGAFIAVHATESCDEPPLATTTAGVSGSFSVNVSHPLNQTRNYRLRISDAAGNGVCHPLTRTYVHDNQVLLTSFFPNNTIGMSDAPAVTVNTEANATVELFEGVGCPGVAATATFADFGGAASMTAPQLGAEGPVSYSVRITDDAGNTQCFGPFVYTYDATPPEVPSVSGSPAPLGQLFVSWPPVTDNSGLPVSYDARVCAGVCTGELFAAVAGTSTSFTGLNDCTAYNVEVRVTDVAGNSSIGSALQVTSAPAVTGLNVIGAMGRPELSWDAYPGALTYFVAAVDSVSQVDLLGGPIGTTETNTYMPVAAARRDVTYRVRADLGTCLSQPAERANFAEQEGLLPINGVATQQGLTGSALVTLRDVTDDGVADFAVGSPAFNGNRGRVDVYSGRTHQLFATFEPAADAPADQDGRFGFALAEIDDVTGDGRPELAVGAPFGTTNNDGAVYLFDVAKKRQLWRFGALTNNGRLGTSVVGVPPTNADSNGLPDIAAGAPLASVGGPGRGLVYIISGGGVNYFTIQGAADGEQFGSSLACCIDFDADGPGLGTPDGQLDFIVGAPFHNAPLANGRISIRSGAFADGAAQIGELIGPSGAHTGTSLAVIGDANEVLGPDLAVAGMGPTGDVGIYDGGSLELVGSFASPSGATVARLAPAGDVDADGAMDLAVGFPDALASPVGSGRAMLLSVAKGAGSPANLRALWELPHPSNGNTRYGDGIAGGRDFNGDGLPEVLAGESLASGDTVGVHTHNSFVLRARLADTPDYKAKDGYEPKPLVLRFDTNINVDAIGGIAPFVHSVTAQRLTSSTYHGPTGAYFSGPGPNTAVDLLQVEDATGRIAFSRVFAAARQMPSAIDTGTALGDGTGMRLFPAYAHHSISTGMRPLLAIGEPAAASGAGRVRLVRDNTPSPPTTVQTLSDPSLVAGDEFGAAFATIGDVTGDGIPEWAVGAPGVTGTTGAPGADMGAVFIFNGFTADVVARLEGGAGSRFGESIVALPDLNADGVGELAVGAPNDGSNDEGRVTVFDGDSLNTTPTLLYSWAGSGLNAHLGRRMAYVGKASPTNLTGLVVSSVDGAPGGRVTMYRLGETNEQQQWTVTGMSGEQLGDALAYGGDLNDDGFFDVFVGAPGADSNTGRVQLLRGDTGAVIASSTGANAGDRYGSSVVLLGDTNSDTVQEFLVGSPGHDVGRGRAQIVQCQGYNCTATIFSFIDNIVGPPGTNAFGSDVVAVGDWNNDGSFDFAVSAPQFDGAFTDAGRTDIFASTPAPMLSRPFSLNASSITSDGAQLSWSPPPGSAPDNYFVHIRRVGGSAGVQTAPGPSATISTLQPRSTYQVRVRVVDDVAGAGAWSYPVEFTTTAP